MKLFLIIPFVLLLSCGDKKSPKLRKQADSLKFGTQACINYLKNKALMGTFDLGDEKIVEDDRAAILYQKVKGKHAKQGIQTLQKTNGIFSNISSNIMTEDYELSYMLSPSEDSLLDLDITYKYDSNVNDFEVIEKSFKINSNCSPSFTSLEITKSKKINNTYESSYFYYNNVGDTFSKTFKSVTPYLDFSGYQVFVTELKNKQTSTGHTIDAGDLYQTNFKQEQIDSRIHFMMEYENYYALNGSYIFDLKNKIIDIQITEPIEMSIKSISKEQFLNTTFNSSALTDLIQVSNINDTFLEDMSSVLLVKTEFHGNIDLLKNYFEYSKIDENSYTLKYDQNKNIEETDSYTTAILDEDKKYIEKSDYIEIDHPKVVEVVNKIKELNLTTRKSILSEVQYEVTDILEYDYEMIENDLTRILKLDEFIDKGKGVCQHFALLTTSILRGLGIPARIMTGFLLSETGAGGHAWVEVKVTNDKWLPIEPQFYSGFEVRSLNYFPVMEMSQYELGNKYMDTQEANEEYIKGMMAKYEFIGQ